MEEIRVGNADISVKEYRGQRVVTFKEIDAVHDRPDGTARHRFNDNKRYFVEGEDYFVVKPSDLENTGMDGIRPSGIGEVNPRGTTLITEQGYLMLVKSFTDDLSWKVQRQLVNGYFRAREIATEELSPQMQSLMSMVNQMAIAELERKRMQEELDKHEQSIEAIKDAVHPVMDNWRTDINAKINRIQAASEKPFKELRTDMYAELENRAGCDLSTRLRNKRKRMEEKGSTKTEISRTTKMDVVESDKRLREIFSKIVTEYEIKYCA